MLAIFKSSILNNNGNEIALFRQGEYNIHDNVFDFSHLLKKWNRNGECGTHVHCLCVYSLVLFILSNCRGICECLIWVVL